MSQVNLLPPEVRQRQQTRRVTFVVLAGGSIVLLLILFVYLLEVGSLSGVHGDIVTQQGINARLNHQISGLQQYQRLQTEAQAKQRLLSSVFSNEVSLSGALLDVSQVMPSDAYLTSLTITLTPPATGTTGTATGIIGSIAFAGQGLSADTVATLLRSLDGVKGWANPYVTAVSRTGSGTVVQFTGTVDITSEALTSRAARTSGGTG